MKKFVVAALVAALSTAAVAASVSTPFKSSVVVENSCTISAQDLDFGSYQAASQDATEGQGSVTTQCTDGAIFNLMYSGFSGFMSNGSDQLQYSLTVTDIAMNGPTTLTPGSGNARPFAILSVPGPLTWIVSGTIAPGQWSANAGNYSETMTFNVEY